jgi:hypothetical protein
MPAPTTAIFFRRIGGFGDIFGFVTGFGIDQASRTLGFKNMIETGLVTSDAGIDGLSLA